MLRRLIIKCVCYFPEIVSSKAFREISFERIWANVNCIWDSILPSIWRKIRSVLRSRFSTALWVPFGTVFGVPGPPQKEPFWKAFRLMLPSRGAMRLKIEDFGGSGCRVFCSRDFAAFLEGSWRVKTLISHGRGSKNHNFAEVRILPLIVFILGVILEPKSL